MVTNPHNAAINLLADDGVPIENDIIHSGELGAALIEICVACARAGASLYAPPQRYAKHPRQRTLTRIVGPFY